MLNLLEYPPLFFFSLLLVIAAIIIYFTYSFKVLKVVENKKLNLIYSKIEAEKKIAKEFKNSDNDVVVFNNKTQIKLQKIKVGILNIDFTLRELYT